MPAAVHSRNAGKDPPVARSETPAKPELSDRIDGSCNQRTYRDLMGAGAEVLIVGSSGCSTSIRSGDGMGKCWIRCGRRPEAGNMMRHFLGVDVGGTNTALLLMDDDGEFSGYRKIATADWSRQPDPLAALGRLIAEHCKDRQVAQACSRLPGFSAAIARGCCRVHSGAGRPAGGGAVGRCAGAAGADG